jgi:hypothetical protein
MVFDKWKKKPLFMGPDANSIMYLGTDTKGRPICMDSNTVRTHMLVTGTTGAGKTEALLGFMSNAFAWGSGGVFIDGKGDVSLFVSMAGLADHFGRRDDLYTLNFMNGYGVSDSALRSHRFNPFEKGDSASLTALLSDIFGDASTPAMWRGRAQAMLTVLMRYLCWMRDNQGQYLDAAVIRNHLNLDAFVDLAYSPRHSDVPDSIRRGIAHYLEALPGFQEKDGSDQPTETTTQHGFLEMQLTRILGTMADVYGHIFCAGASDIDMEDIVRNRRFLLVLLPALEKSRDEIAMLGKVVMAALKRMASSLLTKELKGSWADLPSVESSKQRPFLCIFDEVTYYAVEGMDLLGSQARSLNIGLIFATQDLQALFNANSGVARSILANTRTKLIMRTESWHAELDELLFEAEAGRDDVHKAIRTSSNRKKKGNVFGGGMLFARDLSEGEFLLVNSGKVIVGRANHVRIKPKDVLALSRFNSVSDATERLIQLEKDRRHVSSLSNAAVSSMITPLMEAADAGGTDVLEAALKCIPAPVTQTGHPTEEIVKTGA